MFTNDLKSEALELLTLRQVPLYANGGLSYWYSLYLRTNKRYVLVLSLLIADNIFSYFLRALKTSSLLTFSFK
jgi:hypothetical protein